jgi:hypothetical protein
MAGVRSFSCVPKSGKVCWFAHMHLIVVVWHAGSINGAWSLLVLCYYPSICLEGLRKATLLVRIAIYQAQTTFSPYKVINGL